MNQITKIDNSWMISGDVVIGTVKSILTDSKSLKMNADTVIDFEQVNDIDTAAVSLILEWKRRAIKENLAPSLTNLPTNLSSLIQLYGVEGLL